MMTDNVWNRSLLRPLLISIMVTALMAGPMAVGQILAPGWRWGYVLALAFLVSLEAVYTTTWLAHPDRRQQRSWVFRLAAMVTWLVILRLLLWSLHGSWPSAGDLQRWFRSPASFFEPEFLVSAGLLVASWAEATLSGRDLQELAMQPDELSDPPPGYSLSEWRSPPSYTTSRSHILQRFGRRWMWGAVVLLLIAAATQLRYQPGLGLRSIGIAHLGLSPLIVTALPIYFLTGLLLMSIGRLAALRARWQIERIEGGQTVTRSWPRVTLLLVLVVGALAALMPLASTWRLADWLLTAIAFVSERVIAVGAYILALLAALLSWLLPSAGPADPQPLPTDLADFQPLSLPQELPRTALRLPEWLGSAVLWLLMGAIVVYALVVYLRGRGIRVEWRQLRVLWQRLCQWWRRWGRGVREAAQGARNGLLQRLTRGESDQGPSRSGWSFLNWRRLSPQAQIRLLYLSTLRRAGEQGVQRARQEARWPEVGEELEALTRAFVRARYGTDSISSGDVQRTRQVWKRVRKALRGGQRTVNPH